MKHLSIEKIGNLYPVGSHLENAIKLVSASATLLKPLIGTSSINIWCRGSSGAILAALLSTRLNNKLTPQRLVNICHVKKEGETAHESGLRMLDDGCNIIIDDFVSSGNTLEAIYKAMHGKPLFAVIIAEGWNRGGFGFQPEYLVCGDLN